MDPIPLKKKQKKLIYRHRWVRAQLKRKHLFLFQVRERHRSRLEKIPPSRCRRGTRSLTAAAAGQVTLSVFIFPLLLLLIFLTQPEIFVARGSPPLLIIRVGRCQKMMRVERRTRYARARIGMFDMLPLYVMDGVIISAFSYNFWKVVD